jgi:pyruvate formate lyase activating enzyme
LEQFIDEIIKLGFLVKLDTNGSNPKLLKHLVQEKKLDFVAMDIKTDLEHYKELVGKNIKLNDIEESFQFLKTDIISYEFRTTVIQDVHTPAIFLAMGKMLKGAKKLYLQNFQAKNTLKTEFLQKKALTEKELEKAKEILSKYIERVEIR